MSAPELVLHIGMQQSGATMVQRALSRLRPQLRAHGVVYIGHRRISELDDLAGWACGADADPARADAFARELASAVDHERDRVRQAGADPRMVLLSSDHLVGSANVDGTDGDPFRPHAVPAVAQVVAALGARSVGLVLYTHRQDRLMEFCYLREIQKGAHHGFDDQFPQRFDPVLDYGDLIARLRALPEVGDIRVRPFELIGAGPTAFIDDFLEAVGLRGALDLGVLGDDLAPHRVYSRRGLKIALGMNPHLETDRDRKLVRGFLLESFAAPDDRQSRFLPKRVRGQILQAYRDTNRHLFATAMPDLPEHSYDDNDATAALGRVLEAPGTDAAPTGQAVGGLAGMMPLLAGGTPRRSALAARADTVADPVRRVIARAADRSPLLYRAKLRWLARRCDVFLVSFPKCGRTWLRVMLGIALGERFGVQVRNLRRFTDAGVDHPGLPRILATHDDSPQGKPADLVLRDKRGYRGRKVILLVRDPRDAIVSLYFHVTRRRGRPYGGTLRDFARDRVGSLASLLAFYDAWAPQLAGDDLLLVRYEDLHADPHGQLRRVLGFLGVDGVREDTVARAVDGAAFDRLQAVERAGTAATRALRTTAAGDPESYKVRRGKVGGYTDYLDADTIAAMDAAIAASPGARRLGYAADASGADRGRA